jgi:hypothetical protein
VRAGVRNQIHKKDNECGPLEGHPSDMRAYPDNHRRHLVGRDVE